MVLEQVENGSAGQKAGFQPRDLIFAWYQGVKTGRIDSPFTLADLEVEHGPRGLVWVQGRRGSQVQAWTVGPGAWGLTSRPVFPPDLERLYAQGRELFQAGQFADAANRWRRLSVQVPAVSGASLAAWLLSAAAESAAKAERWADCDLAYTAALEQAVDVGPRVRIRLLQRWAASFCQRGDLVQAEKCYLQALAEDQMQAGEGLTVAQIVSNLASVISERGDLTKAEKYSRQALSIRERLAPNSLEVATSLSSLGTVAMNRAETASAEAYYRRALNIQEKLAPGGLELASSLTDLGVVALIRGELAQAEDYFHRALNIQDRLAPDGLGAARSLNNLGAVALNRGDLAKAEAYYSQGLSTRQNLVPLSLPFAASLNNVGTVALHRGDAVKAETYFRLALSTQQKLAPGSLGVAASLTNLGHAACKQGELERAEEYHRQALSIREKLAPDSELVADSLHALGLVLRGQGQLSAAEPLLNRALEELESQTAKLGGSEERHSQFRARFATYYRDELDLLLMQKQPARAFHVLERFRARSLLAMLPQRDLVFASDLPIDVQRARRDNAAEYDRVQAQLAQLSPTKQAEQVESFHVRLRELAAERDDIAERIRHTSPRLAALQYPQPLDLTATRQALDRGTVLLSYSVGEKETVLFVVQPAGIDPGLLVFILPLGEAAMREQVVEFRHLAQQRSTISTTALQGRAQALYDLLLKPAEPQLATSDRILVIPDGPLHTLPFAALWRKDQYLIEWKPLHMAVSATVYAELKKTRRSIQPNALQLAAFGAPRYAKGSSKSGLTRGNADLRSVTERDFNFSPLPFSREEVESIAALFPGRSQKYLDADATEETAKAVGKQVRYLHFATHGLLDERDPSNSAVVLTIPETVQEGRDNGLLQAWEIFEQMRLDADLVVLSGCRTGLGQEVSGEGLLGLSRAFQYAGAHSVLASLWSVDDRRTAQLMKCFYEHLVSGASKDRALQVAQIELLRARAAPPFYWAGFSLIGDWQ